MKASALKGDFRGNGWFAGVTPRRNPEVVVVVYFEGGEHGPLAARIASQVIKAFVDKQRRVRNNPLLFSDKVDPGSVPIAGVWNFPELGGEHPDPAEAGPFREESRERYNCLAARCLCARQCKAAGTVVVGTAGEN